MDEEKNARSFVSRFRQNNLIKIKIGCVLAMLINVLMLLVLASYFSDWLRLHFDRKGFLQWVRLNASLETNNLVNEKRLQWLPFVNVDPRFYSRIRGLFCECVVPEHHHTEPDWLDYNSIGSSVFLKQLALRQKLKEKHASRLTYWQCWWSRHGDQLKSSALLTNMSSAELRRGAWMENAAVISFNLSLVLVALTMAFFIGSCTNMPTAAAFSAILGLVLLLSSVVSHAIGLGMYSTAWKLLVNEAPDSTMNTINWPAELAERASCSMGIAWYMSLVAFAANATSLAVAMTVYCIIWRSGSRGESSCS